MIAKLPNEIDGDESVVLMLLWNKLDDLIDLVNSQQEAIEKLREDIRPYTEEELSKMSFWPNKEKGEIAMGEKISEPADDKPYGYDNLKHDTDLAKEAMADDKPESLKEMSYRVNGLTPPDDKPEQLITNLNSARQEMNENIGKWLDTHRTVTLRIPKGMTIGEAIVDAYNDYRLQARSMNIWLDDWLVEKPDTDLQKALDEVEGESNE